MKQEIWTFVLFWSIPLSTGADVTVTCVWTSDCVLPCTSPYHDVIHWHKSDKQNWKYVHTFYNNADDLQYQDADFKGRTSLFTDQISQGNASLLLRTIRVDDEGRYKCYTGSSSENSEQFVLLKVKAPVKWVDLKMTSEGISCSTKDVYPRPKISWYRDGSSEDKFTQTVGDKERLFSVSSVLQTVQENTTYTCSISLGDESQSYTASLRKENVDIHPGQDATIHCPVSQENAGNDNITLTFGESTTILRFIQKTELPTVTEQWRGKTLRLARDGTVTIHNLKNSEDTGTYTCERLTAQSRQLVLTTVKMTSANHYIGAGAAIAVGVIAGVGICIIAAVCWVQSRIGQRNGTGVVSGTRLTKLLNTTYSKPNTPSRGGDLKSNEIFLFKTSTKDNDDVEDSSQEEDEDSHLNPQKEKKEATTGPRSGEDSDTRDMKDSFENNTNSTNGNPNNNEITAQIQASAEDDHNVEDTNQDEINDNSS